MSISQQQLHWIPSLQQYSPTNNSTNNYASLLKKKKKVEGKEDANLPRVIFRIH